MDLVRPEVRKRLDQEMFAAACEGFVRAPTEEFEADVAAHVRDGVLYLVREDGRVRGFAVMKDFPGISATYISGIVKEKGTPSGIVERIVSEHVKNGDFGIVTVRTQNDRVVEIMREICDEVVPVDREAGDEDREILRQMGLLTDNVGENLAVIRHYGGAPMIAGAERRRSKNEQVRQTTDRLNYEKGDALLLVGYRRKKLLMVE